jgi:germination protein M
MRKKIVFLLAFLCMLLLVGCSNGKETSKYNIEYLNKDKTGIVAVPYDASATTKDALIEEFFAALSSDPDNTVNRFQMMWRSQSIRWTEHFSPFILMQII